MLIYFAPDEVIYDPKRLLTYYSTNKITRTLVTPSLLEAMLDFNSGNIAKLLPNMKFIWLCGEVVASDLYRQCKIRLPHITLYNLYSVSECHDITGGALDDLISEGKFASTGFISDNTELYILDEKLKLVKRGTVGRLFCGGICIILGRHLFTYYWRISRCNTGEWI